MRFMPYFLYLYAIFITNLRFEVISFFAASKSSFFLYITASLYSSSRLRIGYLLISAIYFLTESVGAGSDLFRYSLPFSFSSFSSSTFCLFSTIIYRVPDIVFLQQVLCHG